MPIFPASITRRLRYSGSASLTSTSGAVATYVFRANDLFDPDYTGTGHQPMGFDQLMLWYNHFCVVAAKIIVTFRNTSANFATCCVRVDGAATPLTTIDRIIEVGGAAMDDLGYLTSANDIKKLTLAIDIAKLQGVSRAAITADPTLRGDAATSPTEITYFHIHSWSTLAGTTGVEIDVVLEQLAHFMEPRDVIESFRSCKPTPLPKPETKREDSRYIVVPASPVPAQTARSSTCRR